MRPEPVVQGIPQWKEIMGKFTNPFRYTPEPCVADAARLLMERIRASEELSDIFSEGKMLGVLVFRDQSGQEGFLSGFSGNAGGRSIIEGFVPPIFDLSAPEGHYRTEEKEISLINENIRTLEEDSELEFLKSRLAELCSEKEMALDEFRQTASQNKNKRDLIRRSGATQQILETITKEAQKEKADLKRLKIRYNSEIEEIQERLENKLEAIGRLKKERQRKSDALQEWIFRQYVVHNALGEASSIMDIFAGRSLVPPGGTGECAAPKLLEYAFRNNLQPLAMGEFWYGKSPETAVRTHGHFYPSCTSKCGPLLGFMLQGLEIQEDKHIRDTYSTVFADKWLTVVSKPSGMPSVPGLDGKKSLQEILQEKLQREIHPVHRLDMDTSGLIIFAFDKQVAEHLHRQFESHSIEKEYIARLCPGREIDSEGMIDLPLGPDYDERPRQKVDISGGKDAITRYKSLSDNEDGTTDILFFPHTGRTHQLRVHSAHTLGLGRPIVGDILYGGNMVAEEKCTKGCCGESRLHLHARKICFIHPATGEKMTVTSMDNCFPTCHHEE